MAWPAVGQHVWPGRLLDPFGVVLDMKRTFGSASTSLSKTRYRLVLVKSCVAYEASPAQRDEEAAEVGGFQPG
ncbi:hypothetical protein L204_105518 [Cryptococcus depauperatus]|nr:hypothetical protein L204_02711 [Cryptococcus depauperatus CBS 7855]